MIIKIGAAMKTIGYVFSIEFLVLFQETTPSIHLVCSRGDKKFPEQTRVVFFRPAPERLVPRIRRRPAAHARGRSCSTQLVSASRNMVWQGRLRIRRRYATAAATTAR